MKLVCISRVKNEADIIEAFVRHHVAYFDKIIIVDDASSDGTYEMLRALRVKRASRSWCCVNARWGTSRADI